MYNIDMVKNRGENCNNSDDCPIDMACRKSNKNAAQGRCLNRLECVSAAADDKTTPHDSCEPVDARSRPEWTGCSHSSQCNSGLDCRASATRADGSPQGRCLTRPLCEGAASADRTTPYTECHPIEYDKDCTDQTSCGSSGELGCKLSSVDRPSTQPEITLGNGERGGRCMTENTCRWYEKNQNTIPPYNCEALVCTNRDANNTPRAGEGGDGTCASIGNDQLRCITSTDINGIACRYRNGQCEKDPQQRHPCKLKKGVTIYESYGDYRYELEGGHAPKNGRGVFVASKGGLYTFSEWRGARSLKVSEGYQLCLWREGNGSGDSRIPNGYCKTGTSPNGNQFQTTDYEWDMKSFTLKKDCKVPLMVWDPDCNTVSNKVINDCSDKNSLCYKQRKGYCNRAGDHVEDKCVDFFKDKNGEADDVMRRYCANPKNKDQPACNCLNSPVMSVDGGKYNPLCIDPKCINGGYVTTNMTARDCPNIVDCRTQLAIEEVGGSVDLTNVRIDQNCGNTSAAPAGSSGSSVQVPAVQAPSVQAPSVQAPSAPPTRRRSSRSLLKIIIAILIVVQIGGLVIFMDDGFVTVSTLIATIITSVIIMFLA
jgi:hypothetical protein